MSFFLVTLQSRLFEPGIIDSLCGRDAKSIIAAGSGRQARMLETTQAAGSREAVLHTWLVPDGDDMSDSPRHERRGNDRRK